ncbi:hypothetical protein IscW_ISCW002083 [Ixodes scapularis]|uniref:Uncharacterized protein n=1 Tax=Ixodes scapularis TaxID=6945 RepID=B7PCP3_IXOSC|nr:hypothetical protein IscW_ISCW002083 [Ixodes scapularis]|eukprot:XP_002410100.1 hypothetical protein IscW_ISCW002083 [Ixodes scapularis]
MLTLEDLFGLSTMKCYCKLGAPQPPLYKFMYINSNKTCAVLRATHQQNGTGSGKDRAR